MRVTRERAPAKLNLWLRVLGRRPDGRHEIQSLVTFLDWGDDVEVCLAPRAGHESIAPVTCRCPGAPELDGPANLAARAAQAVLSRWEPTAHCRIRITKRIPVGAGLGGGSSDAAATLRALARLLDRPPEAAWLADTAARLGADVPVCLARRPAWVTGWGHLVEPIDGLPPAALCLVHPAIHVSTAEAYAALQAPPLQRVPPHPGTPRRLGQLAALVANDFWPTLGRAHPAVATLRDQLAACAPVAVGLSGSGPTLFGLFATATEAATAAETLAQQGVTTRVTLFEGSRLRFGGKKSESKEPPESAHE